jgi:hypothetical protein
MFFKVHKATKYPIYKVREDEPKLTMIVQFYPSFDPNQTIDEIKSEEAESPQTKPEEPSPVGLHASDVNLSLGDEENPNKSSLRKTVTNLLLVPRKQTFAEEDQK